MPLIPQEEQLRRRQMVDSVLGTNEMEGQFADPSTIAIMERYVSGELTMQEFSSAMDAHAQHLISVLVPLAGAA